jgi:hypothetical protein
VARAERGGLAARVPVHHRKQRGAAAVHVQVDGVGVLLMSGGLVVDWARAAVFKRFNPHAPTRARTQRGSGRRWQCNAAPHDGPGQQYTNARVSQGVAPPRRAHHARTPALRRRQPPPAPVVPAPQDVDAEAVRGGPAPVHERFGGDAAAAAACRRRQRGRKVHGGRRRHGSSCGGRGGGARQRAVSWSRRGGALAAGPTGRTVRTSLGRRESHVAVIAMRQFAVTGSQRAAQREGLPAGSDRGSLSPVLRQHAGVEANLAVQRRSPRHTSQA